MYYFRQSFATLLLMKKRERERKKNDPKLIFVTCINGIETVLMADEQIHLYNKIMIFFSLILFNSVNSMRWLSSLIRLFSLSLALCIDLRTLRKCDLIDVYICYILMNEKRLVYTYICNVSRTSYFRCTLN